MLLRLFYDSALAQASYLLGCARTGEALVVDPNRDVDQYLRAAESESLRIVHVTESHIHADFVSGSRELAGRTGARLYLSAEGGRDWQYAYAGAANAALLHDGDVINVGNVRIEALHTPGHTPEHLSYVVTDTPASDTPVGMFTGDFVFVGDVGRPDLLERAAGLEGTMKAAARQQFRSLRRLRPFPDYLQVWPAHGAGSACGKSLGGVSQSTLGYERLANWAFRIDDEEEFVAEVLAGQPEPPRYFAEMKRINRDGPHVLGRLPRPERVELARLASRLARGAVLVDIRPGADFAAGHLRGAINIPFGRSFLTWAGWLLPYDRELYLLAEGDHAAADAARSLALIGLDRVAGYARLDASAQKSAQAMDGTVMTTPQLTPAELVERMKRARDGVHVIDVRWRAEWEAGHLPGARHAPLGYLEERLGELPRDGLLVVHCQSGGRSAIAASLLEARGWTNVATLVGGFAAWRQAGLPTEGAE